MEKELDAGLLLKPFMLIYWTWQLIIRPATVIEREKTMNRWTQLVHFDPNPGDPYHPNCTPIYQTATFAQESALITGKYDYTRSGNPTRTIVEQQLARLEKGQFGFVFASGMTALTTVIGLL